MIQLVSGFETVWHGLQTILNISEGFIFKIVNLANK